MRHWFDITCLQVAPSIHIWCTATIKWRPLDQAMVVSPTQLYRMRYPILASCIGLAYGSHIYMPATGKTVLAILNTTSFSWSWARAWTLELPLIDRHQSQSTPFTIMLDTRIATLRGSKSMVSISPAVKRSTEVMSTWENEVVMTTENMMIPSGSIRAYRNSEYLCSFTHEAPVPLITFPTGYLYQSWFRIILTVIKIIPLLRRSRNDSKAEARIAIEPEYKAKRNFAIKRATLAMNDTLMARWINHGREAPFSCCWRPSSSSRVVSSMRPVGRACSSSIMIGGGGTGDRAFA